MLRVNVTRDFSITYQLSAFGKNIQHFIESIGLIELGHLAFLLILGFSRANQFQSPSVRIGTYSLHGEIKIGLLVLIWAMVTLLIRSFVYTYYLYGFRRVNHIHEVQV